MLADSRSRALVTNFAGQWLWVRNIRLHQPDPIAPEFDENLRQALEREIQLFLDSQIRDDRGIPELLTADYTFVNERLARHYGIPNVYGNYFRRITAADDARAGLLGKAGLLTVTSYPNRTSPVFRRCGCSRTCSAPRRAAAARRAGAAGRTAPRAALGPRADGAALIEPGLRGLSQGDGSARFALENFDGIGRWRSGEAGRPIDRQGVLADGAQVDGPRRRRCGAALASEEFVFTVARASR